MSDQDTSDAPRLVTSVWPAVVLLCVAVAMLIWARTYGETAARFPSMVAWVMIVLAAIDLWSRTPLPGVSAITTFWGTGFGQREMMHNPPPMRQVEMVLWVIGCFAGMAAIGILAATPIFCAAFVWLRKDRSVRAALLVGLSVFAFQFAVFEWLLDYELYRGLAFTKGGVAAW